MKTAIEILKCFFPALVFLAVFGVICWLMPDPPAQTDDIWDGWGPPEMDQPHPTRTLPPDHKLNQPLPYPAK